MLRMHAANREEIWRDARSGGFSLMELAVAVAIVAILVTALLNRVLFYQREVERLAIDHVVKALRSALQLQLVSLMTAGRMSDIASLTEQNPIDWLEQRPPNYLGAFYEPKVWELSPGNWYFDKKDKKLVYLFNDSENIESGERNQLNFKVKLVNNRRDAASGQVEGRRVHFFDGAVLDQTNP